MLGEDDGEEANKNTRENRTTNMDSDSGDEGFSSEDESFRSTTEIIDKKINNSENLNTFLSSATENVTTTTEM